MDWKLSPAGDLPRGEKLEIGNFNKVPDPYREPTEEPAALPPKIEKPTAFEAKEAIEKFKEMPAAAPSQEASKPAAPQTAPPVAPAPPKSAPPKKEDLKDLDEDRQIKMLVDLAFQQGIDKAVQAARATGQAYLIDKLHDTLIDELHQQLVEKGKLKEV
jgi:hypothetical protein